MRLLFSAEVVDIYLFSLAFNTCITTDSYSFFIQNSWFGNGKLLVSQWKTIGFSPWNYWFRNGELLACQLKVVFLVIVIEDGRLVPALSSTFGGYLVAVLRGDGDATRHLDLIIGAEVGARTSYDILAVGVNNTIYCIVFIYDIFVNITIYVHSIFYRRPTNCCSPKSGLSALSHIRYVGKNINV